jgi:hypothetical protein
MRSNLEGRFPSSIPATARTLDRMYLGVILPKMSRASLSLASTMMYQKTYDRTEFGHIGLLSIFQPNGHASAARKQYRVGRSETTLVEKLGEALAHPIDGIATTSTSMP